MCGGIPLPFLVALRLKDGGGRPAVAVRARVSFPAAEVEQNN